MKGKERPRGAGGAKFRVEALEPRELLAAVGPTIDPETPPLPIRAAAPAVSVLVPGEAGGTGARFTGRRLPAPRALARERLIEARFAAERAGEPVAGRAAQAAPRMARAAHHSKPARAEYDLAVRFSYVGSPGNAAVGINGFTPPSRATVPAQPTNTGGNTYQELGGVAYHYAIGQTEITAGQYVTFLNKVDPAGANPVLPTTGVRLWVEAFSPVHNPFSGQINLVAEAAPGTHYRLAADFWRDKPLVNGNLFHFAYFANSMYNGSTVAIDDGVARSPLGFAVRTQVRYVSLSPRIETGMYNLQDSYFPFFERSALAGYVIPSQDEWVKAAYFSPRPTGNGTHYYYYPTMSDAPPTPLQTGGPTPTADSLGNVIRRNLARGVAYANFDQKALWRPPYAPADPDAGANVVGVGADRTPSPWLAHDMAGNVVEFTDTITGAPAVLENPNDLPVYVKAHGGVANATDWQLWLTATGTTDPYGQQAGLTSTQGGARFGFLPGRAADRSLRGARHARASALARPPLSEGLVYLLRNQASGEVVRIDDLAEAVRLAQAPSSFQLLGASNPEIS